MAITVLTDAFISINGVTLSDRAKSVTINQEFDDLDSTAFGATKRAHEVGLGDDSFEVEFYQDFAAAKTDATLSPLVGSNAGFPFEVRPTSAAVSTTNPKYTGTGKLFTYSPIAGEVGELSTTSVEFKTNGITRATA